MARRAAFAPVHRSTTHLPPLNTDVDQQKAMVMAIMPDFWRGAGDWDRRAIFEGLTNGFVDNHSGSGGGGGGGSGMFPIFQQCCNAEYAGMVKAIGDLQGDMVRYRATQMLLLVACVFVVCFGG